MHANRLQLNPAKTEILWSATGRRLHQLPQLPLRVCWDLVLPTGVVCELGVFIDADVSVKTHVAQTVSACFAVLRQLRSIRRSMPRPVLQKLVVSLVLSWLDYGNATLVGIPMYQLKWLQSVLNAAARLVFSSPRRDHVSPLLLQLHWLKAPEQIQYKLAVLVPQWNVPFYLAGEFLQPADLTTRTRLCSASSLFICRTQLSTVGDQAFPVAAACVWNSLPRRVTSAPSLFVYCSRLKSHLFKQSFLWLLLL